MDLYGRCARLYNDYYYGPSSHETIQEGVIRSLRDMQYLEIQDDVRLAVCGPECALVALYTDWRRRFGPAVPIPIVSDQQMLRATVGTVDVTERLRPWMTEFRGNVCSLSVTPRQEEEEDKTCDCSVVPRGLQCVEYKTGGECVHLSDSHPTYRDVLDLPVVDCNENDEMVVRNVDGSSERIPLDSVVSIRW